MTHTIAEPSRIDRHGLFSQHAREAAVDFDLGPEGCGSG